ncbi:conjugal transfer protein TrbC [Helicobacter monodelphidis]|uniref:TrbC/VirB2 family protein n=1 Tax=Helicobacter sp. 15-1451 TaxID=2004995 RepID=UPI000DCC8DE7|nr:TrbC/VirB2 family protein [Helicobacter sp. 15-1451]RAX56476.1 conjugal transfer protein TrbC [Helicobacter sp. 15-1451]
MRKYLILFAFFGVMFALASTAGAGLPWEQPLETVKRSITGPVAATISLLAIVACGAMLVWGGEFSNFLKTLVYTVLVVAIIIGAANVINIFSGGGVVF